MNTENYWYCDWYENQATDQEKYLVEKVISFSDLFADMLFEPETSTFKLIQCQSRMSESGEWTDAKIILPSELSAFTYSFFHFKVASLEKGGGLFNPREQALIISPESLENDSIILHELIHLHEFVLNELPMFYHDMVYWALYKDLKEKIPQLDDIITGHAHLLTGSLIYLKGGVHDILFLLKSFDLDIRKGYPLGTVFAYGRDIELKEYSYIRGIE